MLCQFSFENFKSYKNEAVLDFCADNIDEHKKSLIVDKYTKEKFLPVCVLYGANGGGKSNVLEALSFIPKMVSKYIFFDNNFLKEKYHKFDNKCKKLPIKFDFLFRIEDNTFKYFISFIENKIIEENLYYKNAKEDNAKIIFERNADKIELGDILKDIHVKNINENIPLLIFIEINYNFEIIKKIINWFSNTCIINFDMPISDIQYPLLVNKQKEKFFNLINLMGINIKDVRFEKDKNNQIKEIYMKHQDKNGNIIELPFLEESAGIRKVFSLLYSIISSIEQGKLIIIDELDVKLHPGLLQYIIELFTNPKINKKGAQLVFTSHDTYTMNPQIFRRDEIYFCALNSNNASTLYSLSALKNENEKKPKKNEQYAKKYLEGKYGADPYLRKILSWDEIIEKK